MADRSASKDESRKVRIPVNVKKRAETGEGAGDSEKNDGAAGNVKEADAAQVVAEAGSAEQGAAEAEAPLWRDRYLRMAADLENTKKRLERIHSDRALAATASTSLMRCWSF